MPIEAVTRAEWKLHNMPSSHATIRLSRYFSGGEIEKMKLGFRPESMDDHWFIFYEKDRIHIHRSWTGHCIYIVRFEDHERGYVACELQANRDPEQYRPSSDDYDEQMAFWVIDFILLGRTDARMPRPI
jgi:hypothetical protein